MAHPSDIVWLAGQVRNICAKFYGGNEGVREEEEDRFASFGPKVFRSLGQRDGEGGLISVCPPHFFRPQRDFAIALFSPAHCE